MEFVISYDMRAPNFGASTQEIYTAALDQCEWADDIGFDVIGLGEHHCVRRWLPTLSYPHGGSNRWPNQTASPSDPNVLLAPLYEPIKLAEDLSVLQYICAMDGSKW